jgi:N-dimethylarginine dimethylaminohydrolase
MENKKSLDFTKTVYELCRDHPELPEVLQELGFTDITKPGMLSTAGRFMTLTKGAAMKKISLDTIKETLAGKGYDIIG